MKISIKNMVCPRCIKVVRESLEQLGHKVSQVSLGEVVLEQKIASKQLEDIQMVLVKNGFEIIREKENTIVEKIKTLIIKTIHHENHLANLTTNFSDYISKNIGKDYSYLSKLFSSLEHITIERFIILQKTERVKELLTYDELTLSEISHLLGYSSVQHLSNQFKNITGVTPTQFKKTNKHRRTLDQII